MLYIVVAKQPPCILRTHHFAYFHSKKSVVTYLDDGKEASALSN